MFKYFTIQGNQKWDIGVLNKLVNEYNNTTHSTIGVTPKEASEDPNLLMIPNLQKPTLAKPTFKIGTRVRIYRYKNKFEKGYTYKFSKEIFIVNKIYHSDPITYGLCDLEGEKILGRFYSNELLKTEF